MANKNVILPYNSIPAVAANMVAEIISPVTDVMWMDNIGFSVKWTSANAVGVITVEGSQNYLSTPNNPGDWFPLTFNPAIDQPASNNNLYGIAIRDFPWRYIRFHYVPGSGTGTLEIWLTAKEK
jgi:hypothetical protein